MSIYFSGLKLQRLLSDCMAGLYWAQQIMSRWICFVTQNVQTYEYIFEFEIASILGGELHYMVGEAALRPPTRGKRRPFTQRLRV